MIDETLFLNELAKKVGQEDHSRESIKSRFGDFKKYINSRFKFDCPIVIVGGTNGKGEVCQGISYLAHQNGKNVAHWSSPHIVSLCERYWYNGELVPWIEITQIITNELREEDSKPPFSMFEILFVSFLEWIKDKKLDLIVLEVGLGGRLDAVNVFDSKVSIITSISRDHTAYLGNSYEKILNEKFEIVRDSSFFIGQSALHFIRKKMEEKALLRGCDYLIINQNNFENYSEGNKHIIQLCLKRLYPEEAFLSELPPRVENWQNQVYFNGAHNIDGMREFMKKICKEKWGSDKKLIFAFSNRPHSEVMDLLKVIKSYQGAFLECTMSSFEHSRSLNCDESRQLALVNAMLFEIDWKKYIEKTIRNKEKIFVIGSYYFVGEVKRYLSAFSA